MVGDSTSIWRDTALLPGTTQTALLMANADGDHTGAIYHILGQYTANWFYKAKYFEEVILLMDCCRENQKDMGLNMSFKDINAPGAVNKVKRFYWIWHKVVSSLARKGY